MYESDTETIVHVGTTVPESYLRTYRSDCLSLDLWWCRPSHHVTWPLAIIKIIFHEIRTGKLVRRYYPDSDPLTLLCLTTKLCRCWFRHQFSWHHH